MVANVGPLVVPMTLARLQAKFQLPPSLFSHNTQTTTAQNVHAQAPTSAKGVLGRISKQLSISSHSGQPPMRVKMYSTAGNSKILEGAADAPTIVSSSGPVRLARYTEVRADLESITFKEAESVFGETHASVAASSITGAEELKAFMDAPEAAIKVPFGTGEVSNQLKQIAKVINARRLTEAERDVFFLSCAAHTPHTRRTPWPWPMHHDAVYLADAPWAVSCGPPIASVRLSPFLQHQTRLVCRRAGTAAGTRTAVSSGTLNGASLRPGCPSSWPK